MNLTPTPKVAEKLGVTRETVRRHAKKLGDLGIMPGGERLFSDSEVKKIAAAIKAARPGRRPQPDDEWLRRQQERRKRQAQERRAARK